MHAARRLLARLAALTLIGLSAFGAGAQIIFTPLPKPFPIPIFSPEDLVEITAGDYHTCVRKRNGNVYCWGLNQQGQAGVRGSTACNGTNCVTKPTLVMGAIRQVESGRDHTCALDNAGTLRCWGNSNYGQLGAGVTGDTSLNGPLTVAGVFTSVSAGQSSTCANSSTGIFCWGRIMNSVYGQTLPVRVYAGTDYQALSVGHQHACAIFATGSWREVDCFGANGFGQAGVDPAVMPNVPWETPSLLGISSNRVSTQADFTCSDQTTGIVQCVGQNYYGQLGSGSLSPSFTHQPQTVGAGKALSGVSTGAAHACALDPSAKAWCWGLGNWGQVGVDVYTYPQTTRFATPQPVPDGRSYRAVAAGLLHTCAIGTDNNVWCWGDNRFGQLGSGTPGGWGWRPYQAMAPV